MSASAKLLVMIIRPQLLPAAVGTICSASRCGFMVRPSVCLSVRKVVHFTSMFKFQGQLCQPTVPHAAAFLVDRLQTNQRPTRLQFTPAYNTDVARR